MKEAIEYIYHVDQPLWGVMDAVTKTEVMQFLSSQSEYRSVIHLKFDNHSAKGINGVASKTKLVKSDSALCY